MLLLFLRTPILCIWQSNITSSSSSKTNPCELPILYHLQETLNSLPDPTDSSTTHYEWLTSSTLLSSFLTTALNERQLLLGISWSSYSRLLLRLGQERKIQTILIFFQIQVPHTKIVPLSILRKDLAVAGESSVYYWLSCWRTSICPELAGQINTST